MVKRLRLRPLTAATRVRIPIESPHRKKAGLCTCLFSYSENGVATKRVKHIILWKLKEMSETEKAERVQKIKEGLEGLSGKIPGMTDIHVIIDKLATSTADAMLDSTFESAEALKVYSSHPDHVAVADTFIRPYIEIRSCIDYEI